MRELGRLFRSYWHDQHAEWPWYVQYIEWMLNTIHEATGITLQELFLKESKYSTIYEAVEYPSDSSEGLVPTTTHPWMRSAWCAIMWSHCMMRDGSIFLHMRDYVCGGLEFGKHFRQFMSTSTTQWTCWQFTICWKMQPTINFYYWFIYLEKKIDGIYSFCHLIYITQGIVEPFQ